MKTEFELEVMDNIDVVIDLQANIRIIGTRPKHHPYVIIEIHEKQYWIQDKDLEKFATNILKALGKFKP